MSNVGQSYNALAVYAAEDEGYFVMEPTTDATRGMYRAVLFAGTLPQCLDWITAHIRDDRP
jgi:hypothetical protein